MKKISLPSAPVCQPITEIVGPGEPDPAYQSVNAETVSTSAATQVSRPPIAQNPPEGRRKTSSSSGSKNGSSCSAE